MRVLYGIENQYLDVTHCFNDSVYIPEGDGNRAKLFTDPIVGRLKHVIIYDDRDVPYTVLHDSEYLNHRINGVFSHENRQLPPNWNAVKQSSTLTPEQKLGILHKQLTIQFGDKMDEYPEQIMAMTYIKPHHVVLELGGNIGRNSCVIASILNDSSDLVVLECSPRHAKELEINRNSNNLSFHIEASALSKIPLQQKDWNTIPVENNVIFSGWSPISTITYSQLISKYNKRFNVLVADCEGALYYILRDMPETLDGIHTLILENDFMDKGQGDWVHDFLRSKNFKADYELSGGWGHYHHCFFQVWVRNETQ